MARYLNEGNNSASTHLSGSLPVSSSFPISNMTFEAPPFGVPEPMSSHLQ